MKFVYELFIYLFIFNQSQIVLNSMHRYQPRIHVIEVGGGAHEQKSLQTHSFPETQFISVTAYQNTDVSKTKALVSSYEFH